MQSASLRPLCSSAVSRWPLQAGVILSLQVPASPGLSPEHWGTKTLISGLIVGTVIAVLGILVWQFALKSIMYDAAPRITVFFTALIAAGFATFIASYADVFKKTTYIPTTIPAPPTLYRPDWHVVFWGSVWAAVTAYYLVASLCAIWTKEHEEFKSKKLSASLKVTARQRDLLAKIVSFANEMVTTKIERFSALTRQMPVTPEAFIGQLNPGFQVQLIMQMIHVFYKPETDTEYALRLGLWKRAQGVDGSGDILVKAYSWNGKTQECFKNSYPERMRLVNPSGVISEVVKCYNSNERIKIIPDCLEAETQGVFSFFSPEQKVRLRSTVLYKHLFMRQSPPEAVVLLMVSDVPDYFHAEDKDLIRDFLSEMLTRVEMEWILLQLTADFVRPERAA